METAIRDIREYHERTKHSAAKLRSNRHFLDWEIQPLPFKIYKNVRSVALPRDLGATKVSVFDALAGFGGDAGESVPDLLKISRLLHFSAGITRVREYPGGQFHFRAAACTGALYHVDLYLICGGLPDLEAGVYQFGVHDLRLYQLRSGDFRRALWEACGEDPLTASAPVWIVCASTFWRNAWKYRDRAYRHCFWDSGTIIANLLAVASANCLPARVLAGFVDDSVSRLLALDRAKELPISVIAVGRSRNPAVESPPVNPIHHDTEPLSKREVEYPLIAAAHAISSLGSPAEVRAWRKNLVREMPAPRGKVMPLPRRPIQAGEDIESVILRRGSTRAFASRAISLEQLSTLLESAIRPVPADFSAADALALNDLYLIVHAVDGLAPGKYFYRPEQHAVELINEGLYRREAAYLGLGQELPGDAAVNLYFLSDLDWATAQLGNRGYRAAQLEAAILGGRAYLAAYAQRFGATGLTFFDDDVVAFFSPHGARKSVMFLIAAGKAKRRTKNGS